MNPEIFQLLELNYLNQFTIDVLKDDENDVFTPFLVRRRVPYRLVSYCIQEATMKDRSTQIHFVIPLSRPNIEDEDIVDGIIPGETKVKSDTLTGAD